MYFLPKIYLFCAVFATMTKGDINKFFPQIKGDLGNVIWAHAVNNRSYLEQTLRNAEIMMIEADVICDSQTKKAMMAHSVDDKSDLSLEKFLEEIDAFNENADILSGKGKGLKLDFKTLEAVKSSLDSIRKYNKGKYPFWLNADILPADKKIALEVNTKIEPVNADGFLSNIKFFPNSVISLGWTTDLTNSKQSYTDDNVNEMLETIKSNQGYNEAEALDKNSALEIKHSQIFQDRNDKSTKEEMGRELKENNDKIVEYIICLRQHRDELVYIIEKQYKERKKLETEMERITYKLCLINKSMAQRIKTKNLYDETIKEIESNYCHLIKDSEKILGIIRNRYEKLESMINKKTSTDETIGDENASGEHPDKIFKCPKLISTLDRIGTKCSNTSNDSLT